jgi:hypothetical protein
LSTGEVSVLRQVLAQQSIGVFVDTALPWTVRIGEVHLDANDLCEALMSGHLASLIVGQGQATLGVDTLQHVTEAGDGCIGRGIADLGEGYKQRRALDQSSYDGLAATALDQVALPVSRNDALLDLGRSHVDRDHVGNFPASILTPCPWKSAATSLPQATEQLRAQFALRHRVQRRIDSLVARVLDLPRFGGQFIVLVS